MISPEVARHLPAEDLDERGIFKLKGIAAETMLYAVRDRSLSESCA
jgi:class 3 adenylate cyclase